jgi:hypothetical protein
LSCGAEAPRGERRSSVRAVGRQAAPWCAAVLLLAQVLLAQVEFARAWSPVAVAGCGLRAIIGARAVRSQQVLPLAS